MKMSHIAMKKFRFFVSMVIITQNGETEAVQLLLSKTDDLPMLERYVHKKYA